MGRRWGGIVIEVYSVWYVVNGRIKNVNLIMISYKKLDVWIYSMETVKQIYTLTMSYPEGERYGLTPQTRRAAVSIPYNIAEGLGRKHKKDTVQFLHIAKGSAFELEPSTINYLHGPLSVFAVYALNSRLQYQQKDDTQFQCGAQHFAERSF